jgi:predicted amidohydrolase
MADTQDLSYTALALQIKTLCVNHAADRAQARALMNRSLDAVAAHVKNSKGFIRSFSGTEVRLVVLPEYFLTGFPLQESPAEWRDKAALEIDGPEYEALGKIAQDADVYLAGNVYEQDPNFPELFFQCCFIMSPSGDPALRYRRLISLSTPSPYDVWDRYLDIYGLDAIFPVADTPIGRLAAIASEEILYPEIARCHAMKGAEVFIHPTSEVGSPALTPKDIAKRARAIENLAYVVTANSASLEGLPFPQDSSTAMSKIVDYGGRVLAEAAAGESMAANATIDLAALRRTRRQTGLTNTLVRHPFQAYAQAFADTQFKPPNQLLEDGVARSPDRGELTARQREDIQRLVKLGILS